MTQIAKHMGNMAGIYNSKPRALHSNTQQILPTQRPITQNFLPPAALHFPTPKNLSIQHPVPLHPYPSEPQNPSPPSPKTRRIRPANQNHQRAQPSAQNHHGPCKSATCRPDLSAFSESVKPLTEQYRVNRMLAPGARVLNDPLAVLHQKTENRPRAQTEAPPLPHVLEALHECMGRPTHLRRLQAVRYLAGRGGLAARGAPERPLNAGQHEPCGFSKQGGNHARR